MKRYPSDGWRRNPITGGGIITSGGSCFPTNRMTKTGGCIPSADAIGAGGSGPLALICTP